MRKVLPLQGKLRELDCWITGLRRHQSATSAPPSGSWNFTRWTGAGGGGHREIEPDGQLAATRRFGSTSVNTKFPTTRCTISGYPSIGCMTCTRQTANGEGERAGRWTGFKKVECGIHTFMSRKIDFQI